MNSLGVPVVKERMTSRERMLKALNHEESDRAPIDLGGFQTGIHKVAYLNLLEHLGIQDELVILDPVQQLARPCEAVLERFHVDTRYITAGGPDSFKGGIEQNSRDGRLWHDLRDEFGVVWSMPDDHPLYMDISRHPLANATIDDLKTYPFPKGNDPSRFRGVRERVQRLRDETPYAICTGIGGVVYEYCWYMRGLERWLMDMLVEPEFCEALLECTVRYWMDFYTGFMGAVGDLVDVVMIGDDLAGQTGPLFAPEFYRAIVKPRQKRLVQHIKSLTTAKVWYHTCGACVEYIPDLIDNGVDILNPIQIGAKDMVPEDLKRRFGEKICFWGGGIDAQHVLATASPEEVREHVRLNLEAFKPGGGYVFNNCHNIQAGVPPENIVALFDAAYEFGGRG
ncbi:MAG: uroporphyrinogen decarboxylase family protein [Candidatus Hydrogenedentales bacterium]|jgi:uroporphyrinogen decarboxylase